MVSLSWSILRSLEQRRLDTYKGYVKKVFPHGWNNSPL
jgi:hypothetical protein